MFSNINPSLGKVVFDTYTQQDVENSTTNRRRKSHNAAAERIRERHLAKRGLVATAYGIVEIPSEPAPRPPSPVADPLDFTRDHSMCAIHEALDQLGSSDREEESCTGVTEPIELAEEITNMAPWLARDLEYCSAMETSARGSSEHEQLHRANAGGTVPSYAGRMVYHAAHSRALDSGRSQLLTSDLATQLQSRQYRQTA